MKLVSSDCVILKGQDLQESDLLVTFLARDRGRMKGVVKGSKRIAGRGVGSFEPFTQGVMHYVERAAGDLVSIRKCDPRPPYLFLQHDYRKLLLAGYAAELAHLCTIPPTEAERFYLLLCGALERICAAEGGEALALIRLGYELDFMQALGLAFNWHACCRCGARIYHREQGRLRLVAGAAHQADLTAAGVCCPACRGAEGGLLELSAGSLAFLAAWRGDPGGATPRPTRLALHELEAVVTGHLIHQLERRPRSLALLPPLDELLGGAGA
jgi:DNA repair protein RecO (recombination protein O)